MIKKVTLFFLISGLCVHTNILPSISSSRGSFVSLINYTGAPIDVYYAPPSQPNKYEKVFSLPNNKQNSINISGASQNIYQFNTGTIKIRYKRRNATYTNPKNGMTYQVTLAQNGDPVIEGSSTHAAINIRPD